MAKHILIAEDQMATREALAKLATNRGYEVKTVSNGDELLDIVSEERFDVVITDIIMPDFTGALATEIMRLQGNKVPVIAMTGLTAEELEIVGTEFSRVFHKPIKANELFDYIDSLL
jgi:DNA-binding response OmpR family regulator